jgi:RimJ/RimL family protein N-acetyltransferase
MGKGALFHIRQAMNGATIAFLRVLMVPEQTTHAETVCMVEVISYTDGCPNRKEPQVNSKRTFIKPQKVIGADVVFRNADKDDAAFILGLRVDPVKGKYLSKTSGDLSDQIAWLEKYEKDDSQIYFIIEDKKGERFGTIRLYDVQGDSFCWGSWILKEGRPNGFAIESALMVYHFALRLGFTRSHFDVRKGNESVWKFHERFGAQRIEETEEDYLYSISKDAIQESLEKYKKRLPDGIAIVV